MKTSLTTLAVVFAVAGPAALAAQSFSTVSGSIVDQSGAWLPGVTVVAVSTARGARQEVTTDRTGRFEMIGLPQGTYRLEADLPGFESSWQTLTLEGQDVYRDITMQIGSLEEMVTVSSELRGVAAPPSQRREARPASCGPSDGGAGDSRIGGQIRQPRKILHVPPIYPQGSPAGLVKIDAVIGIDGLVKEARVTNDAAPSLADAAVDAVRLWEFDPTLLNCQPVDVRMAVIVDFR